MTTLAEESKLTIYEMNNSDCYLKLLPLTKHYIMLGEGQKIRTQPLERNVTQARVRISYVCGSGDKVTQA